MSGSVNNFPPYLAAPSSGGSGSGGGGGNSHDRWLNDRGEVYFRLQQSEDRHEKLEETQAAHEKEFVELKTEVMRKLEKIDARLGLQAFKAGVWATLLNAVAMLTGLLMLWWKMK